MLSPSLYIDTHTQVHTHTCTLHTLQRSEEFSSCWTRTQLSAAIPVGYEATSSQWANHTPSAFTRSTAVLLCTTTVHTLKSRFCRGSWLSKATRWKIRQRTVVRWACSDCLRTPEKRRRRKRRRQKHHIRNPKCLVIQCRQSLSARAATTTRTNTTYISNTPYGHLVRTSQFSQ